MMNGRGYAGVCIRKQWPAAFRTKRAGNDGGHQLVRVQAPLHQRFDLALDGELDGTCRRGMAVRHVLDRDAVDLQIRLLCNGLDARARADQHRLDHSGGTRVKGGGEADGVARVNDRHLEAPKGPYVLQYPHEVITLRECNAHLRQRAARPLDALGRRMHQRLARDHRTAFLVDAAAIQRHAVIRGVARGHRDGGRQGVADANGAWNFSVWPA
jgi:hypothetical protein